jgi:hypothetical protein
MHTKFCLYTVSLRDILEDFTFMLPCIVINFFLNNQPDALIIHIYSVIKLYMFRASSVPIIRSYLLYTQQLVCFMQVM